MWLYIILLPFVILQAQEENGLITINGTEFKNLAWCDTIECFLAMSSPRESEFVYLKNNSFSFVYIPSDDLKNRSIVSFDSLYDKPNKAGLGYPEHRNIPLKISHAYSSEINRVQDIYIVNNNKASVKSMASSFLDDLPFSIYNPLNIPPTTCYDHLGMYTSNYFNKTLCMSMVTYQSQSGKTQLFAGPTSWNRIPFSDNNIALRYLVTSGEISLGSIIKGYNSLMFSHTTCNYLHPKYQKEKGVCYVTFILFQYSSICCCDGIQCPREQFIAKRKKEGQLWCPYGRTSINKGFHLEEYSLNEYANNSRGDYCALHFNLNHNTFNTKKVNCYRTNQRCPLDFRNEDNFDFNVSCLCNSSDTCSFLPLPRYFLVNQWFGEKSTNPYKNCTRLLYRYDSFINQHCANFYNPQKGIRVNMEENNNFFMIRPLQIYKNNTAINAYFNMSVTLEISLVRIADRVKNCAQPVYNIGGQYVLKLLYIFLCKIPGCDGLNDHKIMNLTNTNLIEDLTPRCVALPNNTMNRRGLVKDDFEYLRKVVYTHRQSNDTGYCFMAYYDGAGTYGEDVYYEMRELYTNDLLLMDCPKTADRNCSGIKKIRDKHAICCKPNFISNPNPLYKEYVLNVFETMVKHIAFASGPPTIKKQVKEKDMVCDRNGKDNRGNEACESFPWCYVAFNTNRRHVRDAGGCVDTVYYQSISDNHPISPAVVCTKHGDERKYRNQCLRSTFELHSPTVHHNVHLQKYFTKFPDTRGPKQESIVCCCDTDRECSDLRRGQDVYYYDFLDENQDNFLRWLDKLEMSDKKHKDQLLSLNNIISGAAFKLMTLFADVTFMLGVG